MGLFSFNKSSQEDAERLVATKLPEGKILLTQFGHSEQINLILRNYNLYEVLNKPLKFDVVRGSDIGLEVLKGGKKIKNSDEFAQKVYVIIANIN